MALRGTIPVSSLGGSFSPTGPSGTVSPSGSTSATASQYWAIFTQNLYGNWLRKWVYEPMPTMSNSVFSGCPHIDHTVCEFVFDIATVLKKEFNTYQGDHNQLQQLFFYSNHPKGGMGTSGVLATQKLGYARMKWNDDTHEEFNCNQSVGGIQAGKLNGNYTLGYPTDLIDTSGSVAVVLYNAIETATRFTCPKFKMNLVDI